VHVASRAAAQPTKNYLEAPKALRSQQKMVTGDNRPDSPESAQTKTGGTEEARKRILDAAQYLFASHGFSRTTTKAIAQRARVPSGLIFYYFPTKQALLESIIRERNILSELHTVVEASAISDSRSALLTLGLGYLTLFKQHQELARIMLREFHSYPEIAAQFHQLREEHVQLISSYLQETLQPPIREKQAAQVLSLARVFLYNIIVLAIIEDPPEPMRFVEEMIDVLLHGIL
jgi:AcrR family transcriptional regulator